MENKTVRYESFGGIIGIHNPPALVYVDHDYMKNLGYKHSPIWDNPSKYLSAPTEVHFNITNKCTLRCRHCTSDSGDPFPNEMSTSEIKKAIDLLAKMKVFHIAFGGGELFERNDAIEIAEYAASKNIVPNATTNGYYMTPELAKKCKVFGQINVSVDGLKDKYSIVRGTGSFEYADRALKLLKAEGVDTGINCVVTRENIDLLKSIVAYASKLELKEVLFIRFKPSGRGKYVYDDFKLTEKQGKKLFPLLLRLSKKFGINIQVDCGFIPHICYHKPSKEVMNQFAIQGCEGANTLLGLRQDGMINACSHYEEYVEDINKLPDSWHNHKHFKKFRDREIVYKYCTRCNYFDICRGGCPIISEFITGDFNAPDPECPVLVHKEKFNSSRRKNNV